MVDVKAAINITNSINVDTLPEDVKQLGDMDAPILQNTGIERNGGVTNIYKTETDFAEAGTYFITKQGKKLSGIASGAALAVKLDGQQIGQVSSYGVANRLRITGADDVLLTADGTYLAGKISGSVVTLGEYDFTGALLHSRTITFTLLNSFNSSYTSFGFVRYDAIHYSDNQEFIIRLGDQSYVLQEASPSTGKVRFSNLTQYGIKKLVVYGSFVVFLLPRHKYFPWMRREDTNIPMVQE